MFLPSTVLDVSGERVTLLRLGHIPIEEIKKVVPKIRIPDEETHLNCPEEVKASSLPEIFPEGEARMMDQGV